MLTSVIVVIFILAIPIFAMASILKQTYAMHQKMQKGEAYWKKIKLQLLFSCQSFREWEAIIQEHEVYALQEFHIDISSRARILLNYKLRELVADKINAWDEPEERRTAEIYRDFIHHENDP